MSTPDLAHFGPDDLPDLTGKRILVTGANSGIGKLAATAFAAKGAHVVLACRDAAKGHAAAKEMSGSVQVEELDLASLDSVRELAARTTEPLDVLVNNAGVMAPPRYRATDDGFELQFQTNHLGHFALTGRLLPRLLEAPAPRVVAVSSVAHHDGNESVLDGNPAQVYGPRQSYGNTKLANLLFARELQRRATEAGSTLIATAAHPGISATNLVASGDGLGSLPLVSRVAPFVMPLLSQSEKAGANPTLWAATYAGPGSYVGPQRLHESRGHLGEARLSRWARDGELAQRLWKVSEDATGVTFGF